MTMRLPRSWMNDTSGFLVPAVEAFIAGDEMTDDQIEKMRVYCLQWIEDYLRSINDLKVNIDTIVDRPTLGRWLRMAEELEIDLL